MNESKVIDGNLVIKTSSRTWYLIDPDGNDFHIWIDPKTLEFNCSCTRRNCTHIKIIHKEIIGNE